MHTLIDGYLRHLTIERGLSVNTLAAYRRDLGRYEAWLAAAGVDDFAAVGEDQIGAFTRQLRTVEVPGARAVPGVPDARDPVGASDTVAAPTAPTAPLAPSSVARIVSSVRGLHKFLAEEGTVPSNVARQVKPPKLGSRLPKAITIAQMTTLLEATGGDDPQSLRDRALLELLYATGARVSEAVALNVDDVPADSDFVRVVGKGSKQRVVPVGSFARAALDAYLVRVRPLYSVRGRATPALFLGLRGDRLSRQGAWLIIQSAAKRAGLEAHISPHTFRHSFATHLITGGADVRVVQDLLGHASVTTTQIYTQVTADTLRDMYQTAHPRARRQTTPAGFPGEAPAAGRVEAPALGEVGVSEEQRL
ncbi:MULTISPECIES: site-specific tyrosine recombinase XerD [Subtercola]|uniref:Tyrosine recombinase XerD n=1 Tax=Subtercola vilae TaxID=2056433 RepID=A0A4T2BV71_9MICO|nr:MULTISPECIES: site-specific tyrosine recombinase XerD [Subtercola]MEA9984697.1 site-specific tyrosine recombinase XerD [Subtercola sp. RTI3]TIH35270.1 site-specific tyrosine recombinase XerD [Subtercola vilae]